MLQPGSSTQRSCLWASRKCSCREGALWFKPCLRMEIVSARLLTVLSHRLECQTTAAFHASLVGLISIRTVSACFGSGPTPCSPELGAVLRCFQPKAGWCCCWVSARSLAAQRGSVMSETPALSVWMLPWMSAFHCQEGNLRYSTTAASPAGPGQAQGSLRGQQDPSSAGHALQGLIYTAP